jgi:stage V sporulation protein G
MVNEASCVVLPPDRAPSMDPLQEDDAGSSAVLITVRSITPVRAGKLFAFASAEIDLDGARLEIHGIRASRVDPIGTKVEMPTCRDATATSRPALTLPDEVRRPIGDIVFDALIGRGLAVKRTVLIAAAA